MDMVIDEVNTNWSGVSMNISQERERDDLLVMMDGRIHTQDTFSHVQDIRLL